MTSPLILVTGATGYVGGRLLGALDEAGYRLRCMARRPENLEGLVPPRCDVVAGDVFDPESLRVALEGVHTAYYMIHSMGSPRDFEAHDREAALNFAAAAREAGVERIVYLGGLGDASEELSAHLRSRQEVGRLLLESGASVIEFRASIILGSGSLSFEMVRALVERLPVMITPRWVAVEAQPILITDVVRYLVAALDLAEGESAVFEIGGADRCSYGALMKEYARQRGLRRWLIRVPFLTPRLSSLWLGLVTPIYARVGRKLIGSIRHPTIVTDDAALHRFPEIRPVGVREAIARALKREEAQYAATRWCDAVSSGGEPPQWGGVSFGTRLVDARAIHVDAEPAAAFAPIRRIGGTNGWYFGTWLWRLRGFLDLLVGGVGLRRGRRDPEEIRVGEPLDFWRVEAYEPDRRLLLRAEMKLPGRAWLEYQVGPDPDGGTRIHQTAVFDPLGLAGRLYWYVVYPLHHVMFSGLLRGIARRAEASSARTA
ncbi:MAG: SDR family oxidoreductase [Planctomycetota bacterium]